GGDQRTPGVQSLQVLLHGGDVLLGGGGDGGEPACAPLRPAGLDRGDAECGVLVADAAPHGEHQVGEAGQEVLAQVHARHEAHVGPVGVAGGDTVEEPGRVVER